MSSGLWCVFGFKADVMQLVGCDDILMILMWWFDYICEVCMIHGLFVLKDFGPGIHSHCPSWDLWPVLALAMVWQMQVHQPTQPRVCHEVFIFKWYHRFTTRRSESEYLCLSHDGRVRFRSVTRTGRYLIWSLVYLHFCFCACCCNVMVLCHCFCLCA